MNINGKYTSENGDFILTIDNANAAKSTFTGSYVSQYTPNGQQTFYVTGQWYYVNNPGVSQTPLVLGFTAFVRPDAGGWPYALVDAWSGILTQPGRLSATGVRSYLPAGGTGVMSALGTHTFGV